MTNLNNKKGLADRVISDLRRQYVLVEKSRVRIWHVWLVIGIVVGIVVGVFWVANRSGEFETSEAVSTP